MATNFAYERMIGELKFGEHLCCIYQNREQQMQMVIPFLKVGLERGEQCFYITDENSEADILKALGAYGLKPQPYLKQGQLVFLTAKDAYLKNGVFDPERMIALLEQTLERALKQGYSGLRVTGEMTWVFTKLPGTERLVEYEARLNTFFPGRKVTAICQFNETRFDPKVLLNVLRTHRLVLVRDQVCENFYYLPPEEFLATENAASTQAYHHAVEHLIQRVRLLQEIKDQRNAYEQLLEGISDGFLALDDDLKVTYFNSGAERILRRQRQEVLGQKLSQAFPEIRGSVFEKNCRRAIDEKIPCQFETQFTIPPYKSTYQVNIYPRPQGTAILFQNVSERKQTEEELKQSEQRYKFLVNNSNELILILSKTGKIIFANKKAAQVSGYSEEEIIGQSIVKFLTKDSIPRAFFALTQEFLGKP
ncbi:MAG: MEDS domain-containing protein, partial [candidate division KSB1 bacterium]|nr:MEDS domain-containing protein [candidate division KSB1 bacterium]